MCKLSMHWSGSAVPNPAYWQGLIWAMLAVSLQRRLRPMGKAGAEGLGCRRCVRMPDRRRVRPENFSKMAPEFVSSHCKHGCKSQPGGTFGREGFWPLSHSTQV